MLQLAGTGPGDIVYDLGSGDGRVLLAAVREFGATATGIELDPLRVAWARARIRSAGFDDRARVIRADLFEQDLGEADVVFVYLMQWSNDQLAEKLRRELRPGTRIVSNHWTLPGFELVDQAERGKLLLYRA